MKKIIIHFIDTTTMIIKDIGKEDLDEVLKKVRTYPYIEFENLIINSDNIKYIEIKEER